MKNIVYEYNLMKNYENKALNVYTTPGDVRPRRPSSKKKKKKKKG